MKKDKLAGFFLLSFACARLWAFDPAEMGEITFANKLADGSAIESIYTAPAGSGAWGADLLEVLMPEGIPNRIKSGDEMSCYLAFSGDVAVYDVLAVDGADRSYLVKNLRMTQNREAIASFTDRTKSPEARRGLSQGGLSIANETGLEIYYLFVAPPDSPDWGVEVLNRERILPAGRSLTLSILKNAAGFARDVIAADKNGKVYKKKITFAAAQSMITVSITDQDTIPRP